MGKIARGIIMAKVLNYVNNIQSCQGSSAESQQLLLNAELYGQYVSLALRSEAVDTGDMTEITLVRQNIGMRTSTDVL